MADLRENWRREPAPAPGDARATAPTPATPAPAPAQPSPPAPPPWEDPNAAPRGQIAGFWMRIFAALGDSILLAILGWFIARREFPWLLDIGSYGRLIGLGITLVYFGVMNSRLGGGATIGKYLFGIRVVGRSGEKISLERSLLRALVYTVPFYFNGIDLSFLPLDQTAMIAAITLDIAIVFGGSVAIVYLYLVNGRTRQSLHDLVAGTFVVNARAVHAPVRGRINPAHLVVTTLWFLLFLAGVPVATHYFMSSPWAGMFQINTTAAKKIQDAVNTIPPVAETSVIMSQGFTSSFTGTINGAMPFDVMAVTVRLREIPDAPERLADAIAASVLKISPDLEGHERLSIIVRYGYDIGITSDWRSFVYTGTPLEWRSKLLQDETSHST